MPRQKLNQWHVDQTPFANARFVDLGCIVDDKPILALRVTTTAKSWEMRELSAGGNETWCKLPGPFGNAAKDKTTLDAARREAKRLHKLGGAKEAKRAAQLEAEAAANERLRLCDIAPLWWERNRPNWTSAETVKAYISYQRTLERSDLWNMQLRDMRHKHIAAWQHSIRNTWDAATQALRLLKAITNFALNEDLIDRDPALGHQLLKRLGKRKRSRIVPKEYELLRPAVIASNNKAKHALLLIIDTGCRCADACRIETSDINADPDDPKGRIWNIPWQKYKTREDMEYFLNAEMTITAQNAAQWRPAIRTKRDAPTEELLFDAKRNAVKYLLSVLVKELGINKSGTHALRRLMADDTNLIYRHHRDDPKEAQAMLGHTSSQMTKIYIEEPSEMRREAAKLVWAKRMKTDS